MAKVFVSHASEDLELAFELHRWLVDEGHEVFLDRDLQDGIAVGEQWKHQLYERLRWANAVVCVVTSAYLASQWCTAEVNIALSRGNRLLPVRAESGVTHALLSAIQHTDLTLDRVAARAALVEALRRVDAGGDPGWPADRSPFPGLRPFDIDRHRVFFGRAWEVDQIADLLRSMAERAEGTALLVVGPSGCGKSSLVRAGLLPMMVGEPGWWTIRPIVPGANPVSALASELVTAAEQLGLEWTLNHVHDLLHGGGLRTLAEQLLLAAPGDSQQLLVVVDQFEELFTQAESADLACFAELLEPALSGPVQLVATLRSESLDRLLANSELSRLQTQVYTLRPLRQEALRAVIEEPAKLAGIGVEEHLVDRLIEDTGSGEALPLLAFTLAQLADGISRGGQLSSTRYEQLGGVRGALAREADAALADAVTVGGSSHEQVIAGLLRLVTVDEQGRPTRRRVRRDELLAPMAAELDAFVTRRLLTTDTEYDKVVIGAAHEAFLSAWRPLAEAIAANASALRARRLIEQATTEWVDNGRPRDRLWGGGQLAVAVADTSARIRRVSAPPAVPGPARWLKRHRMLVADRVELSPDASAFLYASIRHDRYRRRRTVTVLSVLLILAMVAAGVAIVLQRIAAERQRVATARQLLAQAETLMESDPNTALRLGVTAARIHPDDETRSGLINTLYTTRYAGALLGHVGAVRSVSFAPDGRTLATAGDDGTVILWDLTDPAAPHQLGQPLTGHPGAVGSVSFAPDGRMLATAGDDGTVILWDLTDPAAPHQLGQPLTGSTQPASPATFAPDGRVLATASEDRTVILWDVTDPVAPRQLGQPLTGHTSVVTAIAFAVDQRILVTASHDGTVILWDVTDPAAPRQLGAPFTTPADSVNSVALAPDGHTLAAASLGDASVRLWDLTDSAAPRQLDQPLIGHTGPVPAVTFASGEQILATASDDRRVILWDLTDPALPRQLGPPLTGHTDSVNAAAFAPNGRTLATGSYDGTVILWDLTNPTVLHRLGHPPTTGTGSVASAVFAPDRSILATGSYDGTVTLRDLTNPATPDPLGPPLPVSTGVVASVGFAPDGHTLATTSPSFLDKLIFDVVSAGCGWC